MAIPTTQTAVQITPGNDDWLKNLSITSKAPVPQLGPGEVLVQIKLRPINPADVFAMMLVYPAFRPQTFPATPGMEGMGVVAALGPGATKFQVGQRVSALQWPTFTGGQGTYQQYIKSSEDALVAIPDDISDEQAACMAINPVTVLGLLAAVTPVPEGQYVIVTAAGSALGKQTLALCKVRGIKTIAVVRRRETTQELKDLGATEVVILGEEDVVERVKDITGGLGAHGALDCIAGDMVNTVCRACKVGGTVVLYGAMNGLTYTLSVADTFFRHVTITGYWVQLEVEAMTPEQRSQRINEVFDLFRSGVFQPGTSTTVPLDKALEGIREHLQPGRPGKLLISS